MSQAKVEKHKYEKRNRKKIEKQRKLKIAAKCLIAAIIVGAIIGVPLGINYYNSIPSFVGDATLKAYISNYITENHAADVPEFAPTDENSEN